MTFVVGDNISRDRFSIRIPNVALTDDNRLLIDRTIQHFANRWRNVNCPKEKERAFYEHFVNLCSARISEILPVPKDFSISIFSRILGEGCGDLCFGIETLDFLKESFSIAEVQMLVPGENYDKAQALAPAHLSPFIHSVDLYSKSQPLIETDILITESPIIESLKRLFIKTPDMLRYSEYGCANLPEEESESMGCGVASWECGIQLSEKLRERAQIFRQGNRKGPLLDIQFKDQELYQLLLQGRDLDIYNEEACLYFGYASRYEKISDERAPVVVPDDSDLGDDSFWLKENEEFERSYFDMFARIVLGIESENTKNVDIVLVGCVEESLYDFLNFMRELSFIYNIDTMEIINSEGLLVEKIDNGLSDGKNVRIILRDFLERSVFVAVMMASEDFTCVTGDMSFSEAISMDKLFLYQIMTWKEDHFKNYLNLIAELFPDEREPIRLYMAGIMMIFKGQVNCDEIYNGYIQSFAFLIKTSRLQEQMKILYNHLFEFYSFRDHLIGRIKGLLCSRKC